MKEEILNQLNNPSKLEKMYRDNKSTFKREFNTLYPEIKGNSTADFWHERLNYEGNEVNWGAGKDLVAVIIASLLAGIVAKLPAILGIDEEFFYTRNIGFVVFPLLSIYFAWKNKLSVPKIIFIVAATAAGLIFINAFPTAKHSDTLILSCVYLLLFLWSILGFAFVGTQKNNEERRLAFLKYNGDLVVMTTLILIAGAIMTGLSINLFLLIGLNIEDFYVKSIGIFGLAAAPIVGTYLTQTNPQLVGKISPVIAKLFSPLIVVMLGVYLIAIVYSGKNPYNDREFLLIFNALLIGVLAIIFFSVAETAKAGRNIFQIWVLFLLSTLTIIVNGVALSAIIFRIIELGITPNRAAVLGSNVLILINLLFVTFKLVKVLSKKAELNGVWKAIAVFLPIYFVWTIIVTFIFPIIFGFK